MKPLSLLLLLLLASTSAGCKGRKPKPPPIPPPAYTVTVAYCVSSYESQEVQPGTAFAVNLSPTATGYYKESVNADGQPALVIMAWLVDTTIPTDDWLLTLNVNFAVPALPEGEWRGVLTAPYEAGQPVNVEIGGGG